MCGGKFPTTDFSQGGFTMSFRTNSSAVNSLADSRISAAVGSTVQAYNAKLADIAGLTLAAGTFAGSDGSNIILRDASTSRTALGLGTVATLDTGTLSGNVPVLDSNGKLNTSVLPALAITSVQTVADMTARNELTDIQSGDVVIVTATAETFIFKGTGTPGSYVDGDFVKIEAPQAAADLSTATGTLSVEKGGTGAVTLTGILLGNGTSAVTTLTSSTEGHVLRRGASGYEFGSITASNVSGLADVATSGTMQSLSNAEFGTLDGAADGKVVAYDHDTGKFVLQSPSAGSGTVTSISLTVPSFLSNDTATITTSGTFGITLTTQVANRVFAGPATGVDAAPTFRALVSDDIPELAASKITSGTFGVARGGTGLSTIAAKSVLVANTADTLTVATASTSGHVLKYNGTDVVFGAIDYSEIANTPSIPVVNVAKNVLVHTGSGDVAVNAADHHIIIVNKTSSAATTVNLPSGASAGVGKMFVIKDGKGDAGSYTITIDANSTETIDGSETHVINVAYEAVTVVWNGTQWNIV
jgi:hypothetical protein